MLFLRFQKNELKACCMYRTTVFRGSQNVLFGGVFPFFIPIFSYFTSSLAFEQEEEEKEEEYLLPLEEILKMFERNEWSECCLTS